MSLVATIEYRVVEIPNAAAPLSVERRVNSNASDQWKPFQRGSGPVRKGNIRTFSDPEVAAAVIRAAVIADVAAATRIGLSAFGTNETGENALVRSPGIVYVIVRVYS